MKHAIPAIRFLLLVFLFAQSAFAENGQTPSTYTNTQRKVGIEQELRHPSMFLVPIFAIPFAYGGLLAGKMVGRDLDFLSRSFMTHYRRKLQQEIRLTGATEANLQGDTLMLGNGDFGFRLTVDPAVVELPTIPFTLSQLQANKPLVQKYMFDIAAKSSIRPAVVSNAGHVHMDRDTWFKNDPLLYLNFVIDYLNHNELAFGAMLYDPFDAKPLLVDPAQRAGFLKLLSDFDAGLVATIPQIDERLKALGFRKIAQSTDKGALNVATKYNTIENRARRSFRDADEMEAFLTLANLRMDFIEAQTASRQRMEWKDMGALKSIGQGVAQYQQYVREAGGDVDFFMRLLPEYWQKTPPDTAAAFVPNPAQLTFGMKCRLLFSDLFLPRGRFRGRR